MRCAATNTVIATIKVGFHPAGIVISRDGTTAYAVSADCGTCEKPSAGHYGIYPINTATNKPGKVIDPEATKIALDPDGFILYALNGRSDTVTIINITTGKVRKPIKVGGSPDSIAFTPKGRSAYITTTDPEPSSQSAQLPGSCERRPSRSAAIRPTSRSPEAARKPTSSTAARSYISIRPRIAQASRSRPPVTSLSRPAARIRWHWAAATSSPSRR
jgi:YVTN family beta-propeller protein